MNTYTRQEFLTILENSDVTIEVGGIYETPANDERGDPGCLCGLAVVSMCLPNGGSILRANIWEHPKHKSSEVSFYAPVWIFAGFDVEGVDRSELTELVEGTGAMDNPNCLFYDDQLIYADRDYASAVDGGGNIELAYLK